MFSKDVRMPRCEWHGAVLLGVGNVAVFGLCSGFLATKIQYLQAHQ